MPPFAAVSRLRVAMANLPKTLFTYFGIDGEGAVSLAMGAPGSKALKMCAELMRKASDKRLLEETQGSAYLMQYGPPYGDPRYLEHLSRFLSQQYGDPVDSKSLVATAGASGALVYLLTLLFPNKCPIFCEEVTYHIGIGVFSESLKFPIVSVKIEDDGVDVEDLESKIRTQLEPSTAPKESHGLNGVIYLIPTFHNPTGVTLSAEKSKRVVSLAREYKLLVICDDVYNCLHYSDGNPPKRLIAYDEQSDPDYFGNVVSNGSFSKLLTPGLRLGWLELPKWLWDTWNKSPMLISGGCLNMYTSGIVATALSDGLVTEFVNGLKSDYRERMRAAHEVLAQNLPEGCSVKLPQGGFFLWVKFPENFPVEKLQELAIQRHKIFIRAGSRFCPNDSAKEKFKNCVRLSISYQEKPVLVDAVKKLCVIAEELAA